MDPLTIALLGGSLISGGLGFFGSQSAAKTQADYEKQALAMQQASLSKLNPFINAGTGATNQVAKLFGIGPNGQSTNAPIDYSAFTNSPDYAFAQQQGNSALQNYLSANGIALSGAGLTAAINYNQGLATQQYGNYFNRLMQIATLGSNAAQAGVSGTNAAAGTVGNIGQSLASGTIGGINSITGAIGSGTNNALLYNALNRGNPSSYAGTNPNFADLGIGGGVGSGGYNFLDRAA